MTLGRWFRSRFSKMSVICRHLHSFSALLKNRLSLHLPFQVQLPKPGTLIKKGRSNLCAPVSFLVQRGWIAVFMESAEASWCTSTRGKGGSAFHLAKWQKSRHCSAEIKGCGTRMKLPRSPTSPAEGLPRPSRGPSRPKEAQTWCSIQPIQLPSHILPDHSRVALS